MILLLFWVFIFILPQVLQVIVNGPISYSCILKSIIDEPFREEIFNPNFVKRPDLKELPVIKRL